MVNLPHTFASPVVLKLYAEVEKIVGQSRVKFGGTTGQTAEMPRSYHRSWLDISHEPGYSTYYFGDRHMLRGKEQYSCALDLTFPQVDDMQTFTARLHHLCLSEPRIFYRYGLREFAGTLDSAETFGWDCTRNARTYGWDTSHLYHIHLSFNRRFVLDDRMLKLVKIFH